MNTAEKNILPFEVNSAIIFDLIHAQNGTFPTSLRELVMNSIDANSTACHISLGKNGFSVVDNGHGFVGRDSVMAHFKQFGNPHQQGDAKFGRFRIGRGQVMAFGKITWHSNEFKMITDVKNNGTNFEFIENSDDCFKGCNVSGELYEPLQSYNIRTITEDLKNLVKYVDVNITVNGLSIVSDQPNWDYEDDEIKIKWNPYRDGVISSISGIYLYSQGVFVKEVPNHLYALNADVVTKNALSLNMARNEINVQDPLWLKIEGILKSKSSENEKSEIKKNKKLDDLTRRAMINKFNHGILSFDDIVSAPLMRDCRGHYFSISKLFTWSDNTKSLITIAPENGNRVAEKIASQKIAIVLHHEQCQGWGVNSIPELLEEFINSTESKFYADRINRIRYVEFDVVAQGINHQNTIFDNKDLTKRESCARQAIQYAADLFLTKYQYQASDEILNKLLKSDSVSSRRKIVIGDSDIADGWTDGETFIAIERSILSLLDRGIEGAVQIMLLVLHEYQHDTSDLGSHEHDFEFYERFHDNASSYDHRYEKIGSTAVCLFDRYVSLLVKKNEPIPDTVKTKFKFPIINQVLEYEGTLKAPLSNLAVLLLNESGANWSQGKKKFSLAINSENTETFLPRLRKIMERIIKADGFHISDLDGVIRKHGWDYARENIALVDKPIAEEWAKKYNHDIALVNRLIDGRRMSFSTFIRLLCQDSKSGLVAARKVSLLPSYEFICAESSFGFRSQSFPTYKLSRMQPEWFSKSRDNRFAYALQGIKDIVNGLSPDDREVFCEQFLSKGLSIQLDAQSFDLSEIY